MNMNYHEFEPPSHLRGSVHSFWLLQEKHTPHTEEHMFFPERLVRLVFYQGDSYVGLPGGPLEMLPQTYLMGFQSGPLRAVSRGFARVLGVELYPWAAMRLLGLEKVHSTHFLEVGVLLERLGRQISALLRLESGREALELLEDWLSSRSQVVNLEPNPATLAATRLYVSKGQGKISEIAEELGISTRQLERGFVSTVGISAKQLARTIRFEEAHNRILLEPRLSLTELAFELGFADQAHFNREFKAFSSLNPTTFIGHVLRRYENTEQLLPDELSALYNRSSTLR